MNKHEDGEVEAVSLDAWLFVIFQKYFILRSSLVVKTSKMTGPDMDADTPFLRSSRCAGAAKVGHQVMPTIEAPGGPYGERLVPQVVDTLASTDPDRIYASIPRTADVNDGFRDVTMKDLANAINTMAWMLEKVEGKPPEGRFERIAYMGASDIRYAIMMIAAIKVGYVALLPSARNSTSGNISLLNETKCTKIFHSTDMTSKVQEWKREKSELELFLVEGLHALLDSPLAEHYPYDQKFTDAIKDPALICHTSGSTGKSLFACAMAKIVLLISGRRSKTHHPSERHLGCSRQSSQTSSCGRAKEHGLLLLQV